MILDVLIPAGLLLLAAFIVWFIIFLRARTTTLRFLRKNGIVVETKQGPMEYARAGSGPPVVLFHGGVGGWDQGFALGAALLTPPDQAPRYRDVLKSPGDLCFGDFTVIAPSRVGYLQTPLQTGRTPEECADAVAALLDRLEIGDVSVIGVSGGGPTALQFALRHPQRSRALVMVAAIARRHTQPGRTTDSLYGRIIFADATGLLLDLFVWVFVGLVRRFPRPMLERFLTATETVEPAEIKSRAAEILRHPKRLAWLNDLIASAFPLSRRKVGLSNDLEQFAALEDAPLDRIRCPTLVIHGRIDGNVPVHHAEFVADGVSHSERMILDDSGHLLWLSAHADRIRTRTVEFLVRHARTPQPE